LDDGRVTDAHGKQVNFENTVIIMTTNAGSNLNMNTAGFGSSAQTQSEDRTQKALSDFLRPEFLNRVDEIITFRTLDENDFAAIANIMLNDLVKIMRDKEVSLNYTGAASAFIARKSFSHKFGARNMRRYIQTAVEDVIANRIISNYEQKIKSINIGVTDDGEALAFTYESADGLMTAVK
jgi:ATP-dependent Clp protease ATP-binding subunit ClpA